MSQIVRQPLIKPTSGKEDKKKKKVEAFRQPRLAEIRRVQSEFWSQNIPIQVIS